MANVLLFNPDSRPIPNRAISYLRSVNTGDYTSNPNALINPDMPDGSVFDLKVVDGVPVLLTDADRLTIASYSRHASRRSRWSGRRPTDVLREVKLIRPIL